MRIVHERRMHEHACFLTLTYSPEEVPKYGSLCAKDFQRFFKALRRQHEAKSIRYFGCGEYGQSTQRPHYHAVLFGAPFFDREVIREGSNGPVWRSQSLDDFWGLGITEFGSVTNASAAYVAGYVQKKVSRKAFPEAYERYCSLTGEVVEVEQEFSRMSLKPAIGRQWIQRYWQDVYPRDFVVVDGREFRPPRYYDKWMEQEHPGVMMDVRAKRIDQSKEVSVYELNAREVSHKARARLFDNRSTM